MRCPNCNYPHVRTRIESRVPGVFITLTCPICRIDLKVNAPSVRFGLSIRVNEFLGHEPTGAFYDDVLAVALEART